VGAAWGPCAGPSTGSAATRGNESRGPWMELLLHSWLCCRESGLDLHSPSFVVKKRNEVEKHRRRRGCKIAREQSVLVLRFMDQPAQHLKFVISHLGDFIRPEIGAAGSLGSMR